MYRELAEVLIKLGVDSKPESEDIEKLGVLAMSHALEERFGKANLPQRHESLAVSVDCPKTAALFFDRIWWLPSIVDGPPEGVSFYGATPLEAALGASFAAHSITADMSRLVLQWAHLRGIIDESCKELDAAAWMTTQICRAIHEKYRLDSAPLYESRKAMESNLASGARQVLVSAVEEIPIISETDLEWEQVLEFRADKENRLKLKRLLRWARASLNENGSPEEIRDALEVKIGDYEYALRKHGLKSVIGALSSVLDPRFLGVGSGTVLSLAALGETAASIAAGSGLIVGKMAITLSYEVLSIADLKRGENSEVAYCYEIQRKLGKK